MSRGGESNHGSWRDGPVLLLGAEGMLGRDLAEGLGQCDTSREIHESEHPRGLKPAACKDRLMRWGQDKLDVRDDGAVQDAIGQVRPAVVINATGYTNVDGCETNREEATAVNATAPGSIARASAAVGAMMVHVSTDFVFDGKSKHPYQPDDEANPLSVYGQSKWSGEQAVRRSVGRHLIVRTSWLFGLHGRNFVEAILAKAAAGEALNVVDDQAGRPTGTVDLCDAIAALLDCEAEGTVHFANAEACSWFSFAQEIVRSAGLAAAVEPMTSDQLNRPARRPAWSVLDTGRYEQLTGRKPRPWREALKDYLDARADHRARLSPTVSYD